MELDAVNISPLPSAHDELCQYRSLEGRCRKKADSSCLQFAPILLAPGSPVEYVEDTEWPYYPLASFFASLQLMCSACGTHGEAC